MLSAAACQECICLNNVLDVRCVTGSAASLTVCKQAVNVRA